MCQEVISPNVVRGSACLSTSLLMGAIGWNGMQMALMTEHAKDEKLGLSSGLFISPVFGVINIYDTYN